MIDKHFNLLFDGCFVLGSISIPKLEIGWPKFEDLEAKINFRFIG